MIKRLLRPTFGPTEQAELLKLMGEARHRAHLCGGATGYGSPRDLLCDAMCNAIDALAADLTGDPEYFWDKMAPARHSGNVNK
jgi:hypothetical protein